MNFGIIMMSFILIVVVILAIKFNHTSKKIRKDEDMILEIIEGLKRKMLEKKLNK
jgi:Na+/H+ antiporter NhaC